MPPVKAKKKSKKKSVSPAKVSKHKKFKKKELTTIKSQKARRDFNERKKKISGAEVSKQKKKMVKVASKSAKAVKPKQKKVLKKSQKPALKSLAKKQLKSPDQKGKIKKSKDQKGKIKKSIDQKGKIKKSKDQKGKIKKSKDPSKVKKKMSPAKTKDVPIKRNGMGTAKQKCFSCNLVVSSKSLVQKQKLKSPDQKGTKTIGKRRQNSESEVQVQVKKKAKIYSPSISSQITESKDPVKVKKKMPSTETKDVSIQIDGKGTIKEKNVMCFSCNLLVSKKDLHLHLFFGSIKCRFCFYTVNTCTDFANQMLNPNGYCQKSPMKIHGILQWDSCLNYILLNVKREITVRNFCNEIKAVPNEIEICGEITTYTKGLESLERVEPWKSAFLELMAYCDKVMSKLKPKNCCSLKLFREKKSEISDGKSISESKLCSEKELIIRRKYPDNDSILKTSEDLAAPEEKDLSQQNQLCSSYVSANITATSDDNNTESTEIKMIKEEVDLIKRKRQYKRIKKKDLRKIVRLPSDGRYLLVDFPNEQCPEECPDCYSGFYPSNVTLYCSTGVTKVVCEVCGLVIFIVPDLYKYSK
ncbi:uncharacterized protein [Penaeus vannamei]|uniref:uncharacterized protein n=1 Tax=Penaeus vannamei TaxID=6689 RepID=UPI00387F3F80